ncbi:hypothetical protein GW915_09075 [bacterium]|nr:hypothetical protein [bacterium]
MNALFQPNPKVSTVLLFLCYLFLIYFIAGWQIIPMYPIWGVDLHCIWNFHHCGPYANSPYLIEGKVCGDLYNRPMVYPPLHYWSFAWTRLLGFKEAVIFLAIAISGTLIFSYKVWVQKSLESTAVFGIWVLLILQYPTIFQIERASNDLPVYIWLLASVVCFKKEKYLLSGLFCALCASTKLYPVFLFAAIGLASLLIPRLRMWAVGATSGLILAHIFTPLDTFTYFSKVMPSHAVNDLPLGADALVSHTLQSLHSNHIWIAKAIFFAVWGGFVWRTIKDVMRKPVFIFALGISLCTYYAAVSWDYHLILVYPLLFYVFMAAYKNKSPILYIFFILGITFYFFDRRILLELKWNDILTKWQFIWLSAIVFYMHKHIDVERTET